MKIQKVSSFIQSQEMEFINEVKSPQDVPEVVGVDWAASDRVVLACQDGGIRLMGLGLSGTELSSSHMVQHYVKNFNL